MYEHKIKLPVDSKVSEYCQWYYCYQTGVFFISSCDFQKLNLYTFRQICIPGFQQSTFVLTDTLSLAEKEILKPKEVQQASSSTCLFSDLMQGKSSKSLLIQEQESYPDSDLADNYPVVAQCLILRFMASKIK